LNLIAHRERLRSPFFLGWDFVVAAQVDCWPRLRRNARLGSTTTGEEMQAGIANKE
jgi:hypothetical protein